MILVHIYTFDFLPLLDSKFRIVIPQGEHLTLIAKNRNEKYAILDKMHSIITEQLKRKSFRKSTLPNITNILLGETALDFAMKEDSKSITNITPEFAIEEMKKGSIMLKHCQYSRPHYRRFILSDDSSMILWGSPKKSSNEAKGIFPF